MDNELYYIHGDHLGSTSLVTDESGNEVSRVQYAPYGSIITNTIPITLTDRLFTGQRWDSGIKLYDYRARFYDPLVGSFISADTIVPEAGHPRGWNRYGYVFGNPVRYSDPSGHCPPSVCGNDNHVMLIDPSLSGSNQITINGVQYIVFSARDRYTGELGRPNVVRMPPGMTPYQRDRASIYSGIGIAIDTGNMLVNSGSAILTDILAIAGGEKGYGLGLIIHNTVVSPLVDTLDALGVSAVSLAGLYTGENRMSYKDGTLSISVSQDTIAASIAHIAGRFNIEPNIDVVISGIAVGYGFGRLDYEWHNKYYTDDESVIFIQEHLTVPTYINPTITIGENGVDFSFYSTR